jgi:hypothetical protein
MMTTSKLLWPVLGLFLICGGCGDEAGEKAGAAAGESAVESTAQIQALVLGEDPGESVSVVAAKQGGAADAVVVEGRVQHLEPGFALLRLTDASLPYCGEVEPEDKCKTPWDYCCESKEDRASKTLLVEFRGADGLPMEVAALPEVRLCDLLKVRGEVVVDEHGNPVLVADGYFRVERPELPDYVRWPSGN